MGAAKQETPTFGSYRLIRRLADAPLGERWIARHELNHTAHTVYRLTKRFDRAAQARFLSAASESTYKHPHLLDIQEFAFDLQGRACLVTPFTGNHLGLVTLGSLVEMKGGRMSPSEAERATLHLLGALLHTHASGGPSHGPIAIDEVLVDKHGRAIIELYGLSQRIAASAAPARAMAADEIRSVGQIAYRLLTGLPAEEPMIPAGRLIKKLPEAWDRWFERALDAAGGFESAERAIEQLPSNVKTPEAPAAFPTVRVVLDKFRTRTP
ncbi:MAG: hypothetical protein U0638_06840 [Phycisphaerales bacterium]